MSKCFLINYVLAVSPSFSELLRLIVKIQSLGQVLLLLVFAFFSPKYYASSREYVTV